ncbi:hypothetical protein ACM10K_001266, partial [Campylobacter jejuni]
LIIIKWEKNNKPWMSSNKFLKYIFWQYAKDSFLYKDIPKNRFSTIYYFFINMVIKYNTYLLVYRKNIKRFFIRKLIKIQNNVILIKLRKKYGKH